IVAQFPIVLEEPRQLVLMEVAVLLIVLTVVEPLDVLGIRTKAECLADIGNGACKVRQQRPSTFCVVGVNTRHRGRVDSRYRDPASKTVILSCNDAARAEWEWAGWTRPRARTEMDGGDDFVGVPGIASLITEIGARFEGMFAANPADVVAIIPQRSCV